MKIEIKKMTPVAKTFVADMLDLPGSPPVGQGKSPEEAVASLFLRLMADNSHDWLQWINREELVLIREKDHG